MTQIVPHLSLYDYNRPNRVMLPLVQGVYPNFNCKNRNTN